MSSDDCSKMLGGNDSRLPAPVFMNENHMRYHTNASNQLQLYGNLPAGCGVEPVNYIGNEQTPLCFPTKQAREIEDICQQKLQISLKCNQDEIDRSGSNLNQNPVSTGLRLSYDEDSHNSFIASANGSTAAAQSILPSLRDQIRTVLDRQREEFDQYIRIQEEQLVRGVREMKQRHVASFIAAIEEQLGKKLQEKDLQIETILRKSKELMEKINQVSIEAQQWQYRAQHNEAIVNILKTNLQQVLSQGRIQPKEGFGDSSEIDDAASYADVDSLHIPAGRSRPDSLRCRACKKKEAFFLLMPCKHLCLCAGCNVIINVCPVCQLVKTASLEVFLP